MSDKLVDSAPSPEWTRADTCRHCGRSANNEDVRAALRNMYARIGALQRDLDAARGELAKRLDALTRQGKDIASLRAQLASAEGDAIERCAKVCDEDAFNSACKEDIEIAESLAKQIRALAADKPQEGAQ